REAFVHFARGSASKANSKTAIPGSHRPDLQPPGPQPPRPTNLKNPLSRFIGREADLKKLRGYLMEQGVRLLTLTGPPGIGKTRLSLQLGLDVLGNFRDGVFFVPLASVTDSTLVLDAIAKILAFQDPGHGVTLPSLADYLGY